MFVKKVLVNGHVTQAFKQMLQTTKLNFDAKVFFFKKTEFCLNLQVWPSVPTFVIIVVIFFPVLVTVIILFHFTWWHFSLFELW